MPVQIYICPRIGDPSTLNTGPSIDDHVDHLSGDRYGCMDLPGRDVFLCFVTASSATLDAIDADVRTTAVLPLRANDMAHLGQIFNTPFSSYPLVWRNAARTFLEGHGIDTDWIGGAHTMRDVLRKIVRHISSLQVAQGQKQTDVLEFVQENLDTVIGDVPVAKRNAIGNWLSNHGIDTSGITLTSTVRDVVKLLSPNFALLYGRDVPLRFAGEDM